MPRSTGRGELLALLRGILETYDPDVLLTHFGDTWLFNHLAEASRKTGMPLNPNRDASLPVLRRKEVSFFNYGRAHYRGQQVHLRGRWHIDYRNGMTFTDYGLRGAIEETRMTGLPVQEAARRSPGAGIATLQTITAMHRDVLIPYQHQKGEIPKSYNQMVKSDRGGLILQPPVGIFPDVAILDFSSMMASIMIEFNVSPETVGAEEPQALELQELGVKVGTRPGLMPTALRPLRDKRLTLKRLLKTLNNEDPRQRSMRRRYKAVVDALKWLTVVAYGRLGFANSTFGRINAHEVVSYLSRKVVTRAKLTAEETRLPGAASVRGQPVCFPTGRFPGRLPGAGTGDRTGDPSAHRIAEGLSVVRLPGDPGERPHLRRQPILRPERGRRSQDPRHRPAPQRHAAFHLQSADGPAEHPDARDRSRPDWSTCCPSCWRPCRRTLAR